MLIQGTFLSSGVEKYCVGGLYERLFCCRALEIMCERLIQAAFLSSGIEKSCVGCLYKRLFCRRASGNHLSKAYTSCFFVVGRRKIMCWMLKQAIFFFIVRHRKIMCWRLIQAALFWRASKNHSLNAYTSDFFVVGRRKIMCWMLIQIAYFSSGAEKSFVGCFSNEFFCCRDLKNIVLEAYTCDFFVVGR